MSIAQNGDLTLPGWIRDIFLDEPTHPVEQKLVPYPVEDMWTMPCDELVDLVAEHEAADEIPVVYEAFPDEPDRPLTVRKLRGGCFGSQDFAPWELGGDVDDVPSPIDEVVDPVAKPPARAGAGGATIAILAVLAVTGGALYYQYG